MKTRAGGRTVDRLIYTSVYVFINWLILMAWLQKFTNFQRSYTYKMYIIAIKTMADQQVTEYFFYNGIKKT